MAKHFMVEKEKGLDLESWEMANRGNANIAKYFIASGTGKKEPSKILNELEKWERARLDPRAVPVDLPCGNMKELTSWKYTSSQNILILSEVATFVILAYRRL